MGRGRARVAEETGDGVFIGIGWRYLASASALYSIRLR
jgi:hypothetical protein